MISLNHFPILIAAALFPGATASAADEDSAPQIKQPRYEQVAVHAVRQLLFNDADSAHALDRYYGHSERHSLAAVSEMAEARSQDHQRRRDQYSVMRTSKEESSRARYFRNIDAVMANGRCDASGSEPLPAPGTGAARRKVTVSCSFADITIPEEARQTTRSRRERLDLMADAAARAITLEPTRRFEGSVELYRSRLPETAKWTFHSDNLLLFASKMHEEAFSAIEEDAMSANANEVSPEDVAMLGMRVILQQDDESFVRFRALVTGFTEEEVRDEYLSGYRKRRDGMMAAAVEKAKGGPALYKVIAEAKRRITCTPVLPGKPVRRNADGTEHAVVRMRCLIPEIRHIEEDARPHASEGEVVEGTNRSWKSYLEDLQRPATVPIHFTWTLLRDPRAEASGWKPYGRYVLESNMLAAWWALSPLSRPEGTANYVNSVADAAAADDDVDPWDAAED